MTDRERAKTILSTPWHPEPFGTRSFLSHDELEERIAQGIADAIAETIEDCAQLCDREARAQERESGAAGYDVPARNCAIAIRALKESRKQ